MAPAWPVTPPPSTLIIALKRPSVPVTRNGILTSASSIACPKCSASERPLTTISPSPGSSRTRATAVLRRPVPVLKAGVDIVAPPSGERLRLLGLMGVIVAGVDLQLAELLGPEARPRQHAFDRPPDDLLRSALEELAERLLLEALRVAAVPDVELALDLVTTDGDLRSIQDDHVVARVEVLRVGGLVLPGEDAGDLCREAAECLARRVNDEPASLDLALPDRVGLGVHRSSSSPLLRSRRPMTTGRPTTTLRRHSPFAGAAAPSRAGRPSASAAMTVVSSILPAPTARRAATMRLTIPRRKASARTSIVISFPSRRTRTRWTFRTGCGSAPPKALKSWRPSKAVAARAIASTSRLVRTRSAVRSRSGLRGPFQTV